MPTFYLNPAQIAAIATLHAATPADKTKRDTTPILTAVRVTATPERVTATATDRYIVAELSFPLEDTVHTIAADGASIQLPSTDWQTIAKRKQGAMFTWEDDGPVVVNLNDGAALTLRQTEGNYPPVARLFSDTFRDTPEGTSLDLGFLARLSKVLPPSEVHRAAKQRTGTWSFAKNDGHEDAPLTLTHNGAVGGETLRALIQPNRPTMHGRR